ncbi:hypothetical protein SAMN04487775_102195 [Treponema bryantii]|jgi:hypothetical protein|uniref:Uncharacterized protein n=1 Tax=Treponema bryantii TaxID=163 RepID=A0A1I3IX94_9SPIR|nr:DUF6675 family protein [Treponema bryantii]SFI52577.1 hypothetical protein SAMN04487775_102195 [Treponema bryantii]
MKKIVFSLLIFISLTTFLSADPFNNKLTAEERKTIESGEILIKNINYEKFMCFKKGESELGDILQAEIHELNPKYLAEVIQIKPYKGNEDLPQRLEALLNNVPEYAGIPYYSERNDEWYNLYDSATITETVERKDGLSLKADFMMEPFDLVQEEIELTRSKDSILYTSVNTNKLRYLDKFDCIWPRKMKICILLVRDGDNWILYGIGGVNAPRVPFFTERIQTSFINRINTFCSFIFKKF